ncbi:MAG TPA: universal stress protein [Solirubrobacteraceae bacterium]|nr:universal stress protein [Solirubrobacteraceae bacterium]
MFRNVLVGVSDHDGGRDAVALAKMLLAGGGELTLAHVFHEEPAGPYRWTDTAVAEDRDRARELLERAVRDSGVPAHIRWRGATSAGRGLHEIAEIIDADLLVVGSSRQGLFGRAALGHDTRAALNGAPCAVAIAPVGYASEAPTVIREIGVGFDGSPESEHALLVARGLTEELGSKLSAFQAVSIPAYMYLGAPDHVEASAIDRVVALARERIVGLGGVEPHAAYGDAVEELTLYSASVDLLVVGSRSYGPFGRLVHGSTAQHLAGTARCPLLVLTRGARKSSEAAGPDQQETTATVA